MIKFKKSLGQNFLIDKNIVKKIILLSTIEKKNIVEIGPGSGNLSLEILKKNPKSFTAIEKDENLIKILEGKISKKKNIKLIKEDVMNIDLNRIIQKDSTIFGNLPYNISSQILVKFIKLKNWPPKFNKIIFMFQREVGEKIIANVNSKNYSRLSIITKSRLKVLNYFYVSKNSFFPRPKVDSMVIEFEPIKAKNLILKSLDSLEFITKIFFSGKRKMINKAFKKIKINFDPIIKELKIDLKLRPERLDEKIYFKIAQFYEEMSGKN